jgi:hypothetical protein
LIGSAEAVGEDLAVSGGGEVKGRRARSADPINSLALRIPENVVKIAELAVMALLTEGGALAMLLASHTPVKMAKLLVGNVLPSDMMFQHLLKQIRAQVPDLTSRLRRDLEQHARSVSDNAIGGIRRSLDNQLEVVEQGLVEAEARLSQGQAAVLRRQTELTALRARLTELRSRLEA